MSGSRRRPQNIEIFWSSLLVGLIGGALIGWIPAAVITTIYAPPSDQAGAFILTLICAPVFAAVTGVVVLPLAAVFSWPFFLYGVRSPFAYALVGAVVAALGTVWGPKLLAPAEVQAPFFIAIGAAAGFVAGLYMRQRVRDALTAE
jgi:hypothetical protein